MGLNARRRLVCFLNGHTLRAEALTSLGRSLRREVSEWGCKTAGSRALVHVREEAQADLLVLVDLVARDCPGEQRRCCPAQPPQRVDSRLDGLAVERVARRASGCCSRPRTTSCRCSLC